MHGHRGRKDDPLYRARRTLHTGTSLLTDKQIDRLISLFADDRRRFVGLIAGWPDDIRDHVVKLAFSDRAEP